LLDEEKETKTYKQAIDGRGVGGVDLFGFGEVREELVWPRAQRRKGKLTRPARGAGVWVRE
jgi:hypothetical protein